MYTHTYVCICMYVCIYIYIYSFVYVVCRGRVAARHTTSPHPVRCRMASCVALVARFMDVIAALSGRAFAGSLPVIEHMSSRRKLQTSTQLRFELCCSSLPSACTRSAA